MPRGKSDCDMHKTHFNIKTGLELYIDQFLFCNVSYVAGICSFKQSKTSNSR